MHVSRCRFWWCSKCQGVFEKEDLPTKLVLYGGSGEVTILGTRGCGNCGTAYQVKDIYAGEHDVPRQHWAQLNQPVELPADDQGEARRPPESPPKPKPHAHAKKSHASSASSISFICTSCGAKLRAEPKVAGKRVKCPKCASAVMVPATLPLPSFESYRGDVDRLNALPYDEARKETSQLVGRGGYQIVIAWMLDGKCYGLPENVLRNCDSTEAADLLTRLLRSPNTKTRERAAGGLGPLGGSKAAAVLCELLTMAVDGEVGHEFVEVVQALGRCKCPKSQGPLRSALERVSSLRFNILRWAVWYFRGILAEALVRCGAQEAFQILVDGMLNDHNTAPDYAGILDRLDDPKAIPAMQQVLKVADLIHVHELAKQFLKRHGAS